MKVKPFFIFGVVMVLSFLVAISNSLSVHALEFAHKTMWGEKGIAYGQFKQTSGVAIDSENNVYVGDLTGYSTKMIQKFSPNGTFILGFGTFGNGPQYFSTPTGMAVDSNDNVFVADFGNPTYAIKEFDKNGTFVRTFGSIGLGPTSTIRQCLFSKFSKSATRH